MLLGFGGLDAYSDNKRGRWRVRETSSKENVHDHGGETGRFNIAISARIGKYYGVEAWRA